MKFQWRRGLVLVGIHLAICVPLILWEEARAWDYVRSQENWRPDPAPAVQPEDGETVGFNPCAMWYATSLPQRIIGLGELPAAVVSGWREPCPSRWTLAGRFGAGWPNHDSRRREVESSICLCGLIALQWVLVGGFPLIHPRKRYWEPGVLITICACTGILVLLAPFIWLYWLALLLWRLLQGGYRGMILAWQFFHGALGEDSATK
jgi:hypothetical protein